MKPDLYDAIESVLAADGSCNCDREALRRLWLRDRAALASPSPDSRLREALERIGDIAEWIGTDIQAHGSAARSSDRASWVAATVEIAEIVAPVLRDLEGSEGSPPCVEDGSHSDDLSHEAELRTRTGRHAP